MDSSCQGNNTLLQDRESLLWGDGVESLAVKVHLAGINRTGYGILDIIKVYAAAVAQDCIISRVTLRWCFVVTGKTDG